MTERTTGQPDPRNHRLDYVPRRLVAVGASFEPAKISEDEARIARDGGTLLIRDVAVTSVTASESSIRLGLQRGERAPGAMDFSLRTRLVLDPGDRWGSPTLIDYAKCLEVGRSVDVVVARDAADWHGLGFWVTVEYGGWRDSSNKKPDAAFALKLAHAAKAERYAAAWLRTAGHDPEGRETLSAPPYRVFIGNEASGPREANQDLVCRRCHLQVEVKARPYDRYIRVSHSRRREMAREQLRSGLHVLVYGDGRIRAWRNGDLLEHIKTRHLAHSRYDAYIEMDAAWADTHELVAEDLLCRDT